MPNKKALSAVVTTLIIILLVIAAIGIVWVVIKNILTESSEEISAGLSRVTLEIIEDSVKINNNDNTLSFVVSRDIGKGDLNKIKVILKDTQDNAYSEEVDVSSLTELGTKRITINKGSLTMIKSISIAPVIKTEKGKEKLFAVADEIKFSNEEVIKNMPGIVAWWRFEGNAKDSVGNNHGSLNGGVSFADGRFGKAASFDGVDDYIEIPNYFLTKNVSEVTISAWIKGEWSNSHNMVFSQTTSSRGYYLSVRDNGNVMWYPNISLGEPSISSTILLTPQKMYHVVAIIDSGGNSLIYINGKLDSSSSGFSLDKVDNVSNIGSAVNLLTPPNGIFNGLIDEVMIFNRALTAEEVRALYEMDLS